MLKLLKVKVLGGSSTGTSPYNVSEKQPAKLHHVDADDTHNKPFMPFKLDIIDIDSSSSAQSSAETRHPPDEPVDVHKSFSMSYRSSAAAKEYTLVKTVNVGSTAKVRERHVLLWLVYRPPDAFRSMAKGSAGRRPEWFEHGLHETGSNIALNITLPFHDRFNLPITKGRGAMLHSRL